MKIAIMINLSEAAHNSKAVFVQQCVHIDVLIIYWGTKVWNIDINVAVVKKQINKKLI